MRAKILATVFCLAALSSCAEMTPKEKAIAVTVAAVVVAGAIAASQDRSDPMQRQKQFPQTPNCAQPGFCN